MKKRIFLFNAAMVILCVFLLTLSLYRILSGYLPDEQLADVINSFRVYSFYVLMLLILIIFLYSHILSRSFSSYIEHFIKAFKGVIKGDFSNRIDIKSDSISEFIIFKNISNNMLSVFESTINDITNKNSKLELILNSSIGAIVVVDSEFKIILINTKAREIFDIDKNMNFVGINIMEVIRNNQINSLLRETMIKNSILSCEITTSLLESNSLNIEEKVLRVRTFPISSGENTKFGGVVFVQDITNLKKLDQMKTEFVSNVTHELKTPLTSIRGFIETLRNGAIKDEIVAERFLEIIDIEAERLSDLINDILQLSEIESRQTDIEVESQRLKPVVNEVISILQNMASQKGVSIFVEIPDELEIIANRVRIKQMFINLIENAIKYNVEKGSILIKVYKDTGKIVIIVKDTGIGIPEEHISRIFERFYRVDKGRARNQGGTGLGLSIVKHIVNLFNGDIEVQSEIGKGTKFVIGIPNKER